MGNSIASFSLPRFKAFNNSEQVSKPSKSQELVKTDDKDKVIEAEPSETQRIFEFLSRLPLGYMFMPTDVQLIRNYLRPKIANQPLPPCLIHPVNVYRSHPKTLAEKYVKHPGLDETFFFTPRYRKYKNGLRPSRRVEGIGYWKATGADVKIRLGDEHVGSTQSLVFYEGKAPAGEKTNWKMDEYKSCESRKRTSEGDMKLDDWVLCKIYELEEGDGSSQKLKRSTNSNGNHQESWNFVEDAPEDLLVYDTYAHQAYETYYNQSPMEYACVYGVNPVNNEELNLTTTQSPRLVNHLDCLTREDNHDS